VVRDLRAAPQKRPDLLEGPAAPLIAYAF
jgi:hypothetical protein